MDIDSKREEEILAEIQDCEKTLRSLKRELVFVRAGNTADADSEKAAREGGCGEGA